MGSFCGRWKDYAVTGAQQRLRSSTPFGDWLAQPLGQARAVTQTIGKTTMVPRDGVGDEPTQTRNLAVCVLGPCSAVVHAVRRRFLSGIATGPQVRLELSRVLA